MKRCFAAVIAVTTAFAGEQDADVESLFQSGMDLARAKDWENARVAFLKGQALAPSDKRFLIELGGVAYKTGSRTEAKDRFRQALKLDPGDAYANDAMGSLWLLEGNFAAALLYWNRIGKPRIRDVLLDAPGDTRQDSFRVALEITPGAVLRGNDLEISEANLHRLDVRNYRFSLEPRDDEQFDLTLQKADGSLIGRNARGVLIGAVSGLPYETVNLTFRPPWSAFNRFDSTIRWDSNKRLINAQASGLAGSPRLSYRAWIDGRDERWELRRSDAILLPPDRFAMRRIESGAELNAGISGRLVWSNAVAASYRDFGGIVSADPLFQRGWESKGSSRLAYQLARNPENGLDVTVRGGVELGRLLTESRPFTRFQASIDSRWPSNPSWELKTSLSAAKTAGPIPFDELFMLGMERDNDLWLRGHLGAHDGRKGSAPMGPAYVLFQSEAARKVWSTSLVQLRVGPFFDSGAASGAYGSRGLLFDAGVVSTVSFMRSITLTAVAGRDLRGGGTVFYTAIRRNGTFGRTPN